MDIKEFDALLHDAEVKMKRLKALYEQWFQGLERIEPQVARKDLERMFLLLNKDKPRNTAARFRLQQLVARYSLYTTYWGRIARQIEEGTYERDIRRAQRIRGMPAQRAAAKEYDLASVLSALDAQPAPAPAPRPVLSAFSPFAMKPGAQTAKQPAAPKAAAPADPPAPATSTFKKPAVATFGKPKAATDSSGARATPGPAGAPRDAGPPSQAAGAPRPAAGAPSPGGARPPTSTPARPPSPRAPAPSAPVPSATAARPAPAAPAPGARPAAASPGRLPVPPPARPAGQGASGEDPRLKGLYDRYVDARRRNNERVDNVAYDKLAASVQQMASKLREKHGNKQIDFEVVVQNGKVGIKPKIG